MTYSKDAITPLVHRQMRDALGDNAIALEKEKHFTIGKSLIVILTRIHLFT